MIKCDICGQELRSMQGLNGHKRFKHGVRLGRTKPLSQARFITDDELVLILDKHEQTLNDRATITDEQLKVIIESFGRRLHVVELALVGRGILKGKDTE